MLDENFSTVDFGAVNIHKEAIADITFSAISEIEGVGLIPKTPEDRLLEFFGKKRYSGIIISIDKDHQISIEVKIQVRYGINIPTIARQVQEAVRVAVEKIADINLKDVNVNVCGIERGK